MSSPQPLLILTDDDLLAERWQGLGQSPVRARNLLRSALDAAVLEGLIPANPAAAINVEPADVGEDADAWTWLTTTEIGALTSCTAVPLPARLHRRRVAGRRCGPIRHAVG